MSYTPPTHAELREMILAGFRSLLSEMDATPGTPEYNIADTVAHAAASAMGNAKALHRDVHPRYASGDALTTLADLWGITRHEATGATGGTLRVQCVGAGAWGIGQQFRSADGYTYEASSGGTWTATGPVYIPINAVETGAATTKAVGTFLTTVAPPAGMAATGDVFAAFAINGLDQETDEELRERVLVLFSGSGNSGNGGDYVRWMEAVLGVAEGFVYRAIRHSLSVDGTVFGPDTVPGSRWVGAGTVTDVENAINGTAVLEGERAIGQDFDGVLPTAIDQPVDVTIVSDANYGRDWGTTSASLLVLGGMATTYVSTNTDPSTVGLAVGDKVALNIQIAVGYYHLEVRTVTNILNVGGPPWHIYVDEPYPSTTWTGDLYPAGPTTADTVEAIEAAFDALGPADTSPASRWPLVSSEKPCDLNLAETNRRVMDIEIDGVRRHLNTTWTAPAADVVCTPSVLTAGVLVANCIRLTTCRIRYTVLNE